MCTEAWPGPAVPLVLRVLTLCSHQHTTLFWAVHDIQGGEALQHTKFTFFADAVMFIAVQYSLVQITEVTVLLVVLCVGSRLVFSAEWFSLCLQKKGQPPPTSHHGESLCRPLPTDCPHNRYQTKHLLEYHCGLKSSSFTRLHTIQSMQPLDRFSRLYISFILIYDSIIYIYTVYVCQNRPDFYTWQFRFCKKVLQETEVGKVPHHKNN